MRFEKVVVKAPDMISGVSLLINIYRKYICSMCGL